jgi:hypothetical protein
MSGGILGKELGPFGAKLLTRGPNRDVMRVGSHPYMVSNGG